LNPNKLDIIIYLSAKIPSSGNFANIFGAKSCYHIDLRLLGQDIRNLHVSRLFHN